MNLDTHYFKINQSFFLIYIFCIATAISPPTLALFLIKAMFDLELSPSVISLILFKRNGVI